MPSGTRVTDLISRVQRGDILEALEEFYADDVTMQENGHPPTVGKLANRERERAFLGTVAQIHECRTPAVLVEADRVVIHWILDYTGTDGVRYHLDQLAFQTWRGDRIVAERFFYDSATIRAA